MTAFRIFDNKTIPLVNVLRDYLNQSINNPNNFSQINIATGFFYISGFNLLIEELKKYLETPNHQLNLVMGKRTDTTTKYILESSLEDYINYKQQLNYISQLDLTARDVISKYLKKQINIKIYTKGQFHPKMYILTNPKETRNITEFPIVILGSSNFTKKGISDHSEDNANLELNIEINNKFECEALEDWFFQLFEEGEDLDLNLLIETINKTEPKSIQFEKGLINSFKIIQMYIYLVLGDLLNIERENSLREYQEAAIPILDYRLKKFNGCLLSDPVGVGKTRSACAIVNKYALNGEKILILVPKAVFLEDKWQNELKNVSGNNYPIIKDNITILKHSTFRNYSYDQIMKFEYFDDPISLIVIDEAHHLRNSGYYDENKQIIGNRLYANVKLLQEKNSSRLLLITATPQSNSVRDIYNLYSLFLSPGTAILPPLFDDSNEANSQRELLKKIPRPIEQFLEYENLIKSEDSDEKRIKLAFEVINAVNSQLILIRSRESIKGLPGIKFKHIVNEWWKYSYSNAYMNISDKFIKALKNLNDPLAHIDWSITYKNYSGSTDLTKIKFAYIPNEHHNLNFIRSNLYYVFSSSLFALYNSIKRKVDENKDIKSYFENNKSISRVKEENIKWITFAELNSLILNDQKILNDLKNLMESYLTVEISYKDENGKLIKSKSFDEDAKIERLILGLQQREDRKILIFCRFIDTVNYVYMRIKNKFQDSLKVKVLTGKNSNKERLEIINSFKFDNVDVLISSEILGEGIDLEECNHIIHFDQHWNPNIIVQRVGRIDRSGSDEYAESIIIIPENIDHEISRVVEIYSKKYKSINEFLGTEFAVVEGVAPDPKEIGNSIKNVTKNKNFDFWYKKAEEQARIIKDKNEAKLIEYQFLLRRFMIESNSFVNSIDEQKEIGDLVNLSPFQEGLDFKKYISNNFKIIPHCYIYGPHFRLWMIISFGSNLSKKDHEYIVLQKNFETLELKRDNLPFLLWKSFLNKAVIYPEPKYHINQENMINYLSEGFEYANLTQKSTVKQFNPLKIQDPFIINLYNYLKYFNEFVRNITYFEKDIQQKINDFKLKINLLLSFLQRNGIFPNESYEKLKSIFDKYKLDYILFKEKIENAMTVNEIFQSFDEWYSYCIIIYEWFINLIKEDRYNYKIYTSTEISSRLICYWIEIPNKIYDKIKNYNFNEINQLFSNIG